ncbi:MAG TPA: HEAT repeat domain-containing protein [Pyrinomonadaceae bacterium]|nr:HEAT repeat domain-containing protein [Pyrinomonadaceae bacterium]
MRIIISFFACLTASVFLTSDAFCQGNAKPPVQVEIAILKAEDARRYDKTIDDFLKSPNETVRVRTALAAGRIGDDSAIPALAKLLGNDPSPRVREMAGFALGETESIKAADAILIALRETATTSPVRARAAEAAGKIAAANPTSEQVTELRERILNALENEDGKGVKQDRDTILLGLTAALRAAPRDAKRERPDRTDIVVAKFLSHSDARIRADAGNTLTRVRAKYANPILRAMVVKDMDPIARANAARVLGAAEDKEAVDLLIKAATSDKDPRVRVAAIRSLAALKDAKAAEPLLNRAYALFAAYKTAVRPDRIPIEQNEFIEIATTLGRLLANTRNERAVDLFRQFGKLDRGFSTDVYIARLRIAPGRGDDGEKPELTSWRQYSTLAQIVGEFATLDPSTEEARQMKFEAPAILGPLAKAYAEADPIKDADTIKAGPDVLRAFAGFKTKDLPEILRTALKNKDVFIRAAAAELLGELPPSKENIDAVETALNNALRTDLRDNDAQLALLDALGKFEPLYMMRAWYSIQNHPDYLVRKKAAEILRSKGINEDSGNRPIGPFVFPLRPQAAGNQSKLGVLLNTDADYRRALSRKNGSIRAVFATSKGSFTINLLPEDAPLTVDNFIKLARSNYFNGLEVHRVVPNFVMQDGDPRGDGNGGPGWSIRCEINMVPYDRGAIGMALSGKDTGGSQWFATHSPQPHLDGGYTVFGRVNEVGMKIVDQIVRGDKIVSVKIVEGGAMQRPRATRR